MLNKLKEFYTRLSLVEKLGLALGLLFIFMLITWGSHRLGQYSSYSKHKKEQEQSLKDAQSAMSKAEESERRAEAKEKLADELAAVNTSKAKDADARKVELEVKDARVLKEIEDAAKRDQDFIDSDMSDCARCQSVRTKQAGLGLKVRDCTSVCQ